VVTKAVITRSDTPLHPLVARRPGRELGPSPRRLIALHRHSLTHVLVMGGDHFERARIARAFHEGSALHRGPLVHVRCDRRPGTLVRALHSWLGMGAVDQAANPLRGAERGTLFVDSVESLGPEAQRLLLVFLGRCQEGSVLPEIADSSFSWGGRLIAGSSVDLTEAVKGGAFLAALHDCLDKVRIVLPVRAETKEGFVAAPYFPEESTRAARDAGARRTCPACP
jgi:DNA-binding NtrC family response regulator